MKVNILKPKINWLINILIKAIQIITKEELGITK